MKVILYMATSVNGYITIGEDDSDWVAETDWNEFYSLMKQCGIMVMGKRTYEIFGDDFPVEGAVNIVMTHDLDLLKKSSSNAIFTNKSPEEVIALAQEKGFSQLMLIGGMTLNSAFIKNGLVDEIRLSVHPLFIGQGKSLIQPTSDFFKQLSLLGVKQLGEDLVQLRYSVNK
jgi:dihydrofolate reductase